MGWGSCYHDYGQGDVGSGVGVGVGVTGIFVGHGATIPWVGVIGAIRVPGGGVGLGARVMGNSTLLIGMVGVAQGCIVGDG